MDVIKEPGQEHLLGRKQIRSVALIHPVPDELLKRGFLFVGDAIGCRGVVECIEGVR